MIVILKVKFSVDEQKKKNKNKSVSGCLYDAKETYERAQGEGGGGGMCGKIWCKIENGPSSCVTVFK